MVMTSEDFIRMLTCLRNKNVKDERLWVVVVVVVTADRNNNRHVVSLCLYRLSL